jgi:hypothetical protein
MSYTNIDSVKKHINFSDISGGPKRDNPVVFAGQEWIKLPGRGIVEHSVAVKAVKNIAPTFETVLLDSAAVTLIHKYLVPGSATVASDSSLGTIYVENVDFALDSTNGTIQRLEDGSIPAATIVSVWYYYYSLYGEGVDYSIDYTEGRIRRLSGGEIQPGQGLLVDYELSSASLSDEVVLEAVAEANAVIEKEIDPQKIFGADAALQAAATYLAAALVCRIAAAGDLSSGSTRQTAASWLALCESFRGDYDNLIKSFRPQAIRMNRPARS